MRSPFLESPKPQSPTMFPKPTDKKTTEEGQTLSPKFDDHGLIPAMAIDHETKEPLMLAYMNAESLQMTLDKGEAVYYSRSRQTIWHKGATSGEFQTIKSIRIDCDQDALILEVKQHGGGCCHTKRSTCFYREVLSDGSLKFTNE